MRLARNYEGYEIGCDKGTDEWREEIGNKKRCSASRNDAGKASNGDDGN